MNPYLNTMMKWRDYESRTPRKEYWIFIGISALANCLLILLSLLFIESPFGKVLIFATYFYQFALILPTISATIRRLRDTDRSGFWIASALLPIIGTVWLISLLLKSGTVGSNKYGADPLK